MSDKGSGGGLLDELPIDRLRTEVTQLGKAVASRTSVTAPAARPGRPSRASSRAILR